MHQTDLRFGLGSLCFTSCVILGTLRNLSEPDNADDNVSICHRVGTIHIIAQGLAYNMHLITM